jgi:predicted O-methyltransferase YrrM
MSAAIPGEESDAIVVALGFWPKIDSVILHIATKGITLVSLSFLYKQPYIPGVLTSVLALNFDLRRRRLALRNLPALPVLAVLDLLPVAVTSGLTAGILTRIMAQGVLPLNAQAVLVVICCLLVLPVFWAEGTKQIQFQRPIGLLFAEWMVAIGCTWLLLVAVFRHIQGRVAHPVAFALIPSLVGVVIVMVVVPPFYKKYEGLRILDRVADDDQFAQPEYAQATPECPRPELWSMLDSQSTEVEVLEFLKALVTTIKPRLILETGTFLGHGTVKLAEGIRENGFGKVITIESDPAIRARAEKRFRDSGLAPWIESRLESSLQTSIEGSIDLFYSDSDLANREAEIRRLLPQLDPRGLLVIHDASSHFKIVREAALRLEQEGLISVVMLSTPRGVVVAQRREGRS